MSYLAGSTTPKPYESKDGAFTSQQRSILEILNRSFSRLSRLLAPCKFDVDVRAMLTLNNEHFHNEESNISHANPDTVLR